MIEEIAKNLTLISVFDTLRPYGLEHVNHWKQGEFHHDFVVRITNPPPELESDVLVISTNCNGGVKEVLCLAGVPERWALWNYRCPENPDFEGELPTIIGYARSVHWFDPCELLKPGTRSEYGEEFRRRQRGGGWVPINSNEE
ncbi:MAG: hypothetical protein KDC35_17010 [Acidobacteria bacterium]|nr:hypothetical protein [Acidobacteriota bacterium]